jgi:hypothetical protein
MAYPASCDVIPRLQGHRWVKGDEGEWEPAFGRSDASDVDRLRRKCARAGRRIRGGASARWAINGVGSGDHRLCDGDGYGRVSARRRALGAQEIVQSDRSLIRSIFIDGDGQRCKPITGRSATGFSPKPTRDRMCDEGSRSGCEIFQQCVASFCNFSILEPSGYPLCGRSTHDACFVI